MANSGSRRNSQAVAPHFFKIIHSGLSPDKMLKFPPKFAMKYGQELNHHVFLSVPNGAIWEVELTKSSEELWLSNGWEQFMDHYFICHGHFLVFRYDGNSRFHVLIFDRSAAEIEYPSFTIQGVQNNLKETRETTEMDHFSTPQIKQEGNRDMVAALEDVKLRTLPRKQSASSKHHKDAFQKAKGFKSRYPHYVIYMQPSYVSPKQSVNVPSRFRKNHLKEQTREVLIKMSGSSRTWSAKCYGSDQKYCLRWYSFVRDNDIKAGDICAFELITESSKPVFNVTVFRASAMV